MASLFIIILYQMGQQCSYHVNKLKQENKSENFLSLFGRIYVIKTFRQEINCSFSVFTHLRGSPPTVSTWSAVFLKTPHLHLWRSVYYHLEQWWCHWFLQKFPVMKSQQACQVTEYNLHMKLGQIQLEIQLSDHFNIIQIVYCPNPKLFR